MELTVARVDLQKELQLCQGVVEKRSTIPILSNVLLKAADTRLQIAATDLDVAITHEETRFQLNGALLKVMPSKMEMVATDGHRMALINFPQGNGKKKGHELTILIPRKALEEILRLEPGEDGNVQFGVSENHLFFDAGDRRLLARMIDVNFPNYMEVIARDNDRHVMVALERLIARLRRTALMANERTRAVRFDFAPGKLTVSSTNPELGDARETVPIDYAGNPFFVGLNAAYVTDFLSAVDTPSVALDLKDENSQCIGRPSANEDLPYEYLYVVMPMRLA